MNNSDPQPSSANQTRETIIAVHYWTANLLSFRISRPSSFHFTPGHFARLGLDDEHATTVWRPFSVVSGPDDSTLEFFAVLVPGGSFSELLSAAREGARISLEKRSYGFMTLDGFATDGKDLWLIASGTGLGPFLSILRDASTWERYENCVVVQSVRHGRDLAYCDEIASVSQSGSLRSNARLCHLRVVTREAWPDALQVRVTELLSDGRLERAAGRQLDLEVSRIMVCGNPEMAAELRMFLVARGFRTSRRAAPGQLAFENYW